MFSTAVNPMYASQDLEEVQYDLDKTIITVCKNTWRIQQNAAHRCKLKLAQRKGLQFYQTRSHAVALFDTLPAICIEKVVFTKSGENLPSLTMITDLTRYTISAKIITVLTRYRPIVLELI